ncbi:MAG TPA: leucine-rich repeat protein, partial [Bacilli bacterium]|nr:leucine-rich repeat protein [Bacilli bacterium]
PYAFMGSKLNAVTIPKNVAILGEGAFASCHHLLAINVDSNNSNYLDVNGVVYNKNKTVVIAYPSGKTSSDYTVEASTLEIGEAAFYGSNYLLSLTLPEGLTKVGQYGFYACENVASYTLPESLSSIEEYAFANNKSLGSSLSIPDNVSQISRFAFAGDYNLHYINFGASSQLPRISYGAFAYTGLYQFTVPASVSTIAQEAFIGSKQLSVMNFASNSQLSTISSYMFKGCEQLTQITFYSGSQLTSIQAHGFEGLSSLQVVDFGNAALTNIDNYAFRYCQSLNTLSIPEGVTYIGRFAFYGCSALTTLVLPTTIDFIGSNAFYQARNLNIYFSLETLPLNLQENWDNGIRGYYVGVLSTNTSGSYQYAVLKSGDISIIDYSGSESVIDLTSLDLGGTITQIGGYAFANTTITSITLPSSLTLIHQYAFANSQIQAITIPANVEFIGKYAFYNTPMETAVFEANSKLSKIEQYAFANTAQLTTITLPASLLSIEKAAFMNSGMTTVNLEALSIVEIPEMAFYGSALTSVTIPNSVNLINHNAFRDCLNLKTVNFGTAADLQIMSNVFYNTGLSTVNIPANITYIGEYAFVGLSDLNAFVVDAHNPQYQAINGVLYNKAGTKLIAAPAKKTGNLVVPRTVETIGFGAFENSQLTNVSFEAGINLLTIGYRAFYQAMITEITIPQSVVSIDYYAFAMCPRLETVYFTDGNKLTGIYEGAFYGCNSLKNIIVPDSIVEISDFAFYACYKLKTLPFGAESNVKGIYDYAFAYTGITELILPESLIDIGDYAFTGLRITSLEIPSNNKLELVIGLGAFADCRELEEISLPFIGASYENHDISWLGYIFGAGGYRSNNSYTPPKLSKITIHDGLEVIGTGAFYGLENVEVIDLPASITEVYREAFYGTKASYELVNPIAVYYLDLYGNPQLDTNISNNVFGNGISGKLSLSSAYQEGVYISLSQTMIEEVLIPSSVTHISYISFYGWINELIYKAPLKRLYIPDSVQTIGSISVSYCGNFEELYIPSTAQGLENLGLTG